MKKRINTIKGKYIVQGGDDNTLKDNEIRINSDLSITERVNGEIINTSSSGSNQGGGGNSPFSWDWSQIGYTPENVPLQEAIEQEIAYSKSLAETFTPENAPFYFNSAQIAFAPVLNTSNVTDMRGMFRQCGHLISIPCYDTSNVLSMNEMFYNCNGVRYIPQLDTSNVTNMHYMFSYCFSLITIPQLDTSNVTTMDNMFSYCHALTTIPQLDTSNVTNMHYMFYNCDSLRRIESLDFSSVTNCDFIFEACPHLNYILITNLGKAPDARTLDLSGAHTWGYGEDYEVNKQSLIDSIVNNTYDRASNGYDTIQINLSVYTRDLFTEEQLELVKNKGYNIYFVTPSMGE